MLNNLLSASILLLSVLSFILGAYSLCRNRKSATVQMWFLLCLAVGFWSAGLFLVTIAKNEQASIVYSKFLHIAASFIPIFFCHFVLSFLMQTNDKNKRYFLYLGYFFAVIFTALSLTSEIVTGAPPMIGFKTWVSVGRLYPLYLSYFWLYTLAGMYFLFAGYRTSGGMMRRKALFLLLASLVAFAGGGTSFLPQTLGIYPFGDFIAWLYPLLVTYGIFVDEIKIKMI